MESLSMPDLPAQASLHDFQGYAVDLRESRSLQAQGNGKGDLAKAAEGFEAILLKMVFKEMKKSLSEGGFMPSGGLGSGIYEGLMEDFLSREICSKGGIGLKDSIVQSMREREEPAGEEALASSKRDKKISKEICQSAYIQGCAKAHRFQGTF